MRQDYTELDLSPEYQPSMAVTVIIPVRENGDGQAVRKLGLVLASLAAQQYPAHLLHVRVVDDGSPTPVTLPLLCPPRTELLTLADDGEHWGKPRAVNAALAQVTTPLVMSLDADMLLHPGHIAELARWAHAEPLAVALGWKRITASWNDDPEDVHRMLIDGRFSDCSDQAGEPHAWLEDMTATTRDLADAGIDVYKAVVGASLMLRTELLREVGGYDELMRTAEDTELGYRLVMAGAVVVPVRAAQSWHLGTTSMERSREAILAHNQALLAPRVPLLEYLRKPFGSRAWQVPTVHVNVTVTPATAGRASELVNAVLAGRLGADAHVRLVAQWPASGRYSPASDEHAALRALRALWECDPRVTIADEPLQDVHPAPYRLDVPAHAPVAGARALLDRLRADGHGVVAAAGQDCHPAAAAAWLTAARRRAASAGCGWDAPADAAARAVGACWGQWWVDAASVGMGVAPADEAAGLPRTPPASVLKHAAAAWSSWAATGHRPGAAVTIGKGLTRGARRRVRRRLAARRAARAA
jgi:GT2 family glycosyltransferase